ncbi:hypothetical protein [Jiangella muralis]|uniref:hypothetical protein n=1 Tax=Jiangella muralis TaxID=702383 RepID=UPI00069ED84E|nr:hypothetical protein [Jiangella muralis]
MTQSEAPPPTRGAVRSAVEALLRTCADLERRAAEDVAEQSQARAAQVTVEVGRARSAALTTQIEALTHQLDADLSDRLADLRHPYVTEIHALLALLAPWHGLAPLPALPPSPAGGALTDHFPNGFARDYVHDLLATVDRSVTLAGDVSAEVAAETEDSADEAKDLIGEHLPADLREEGLRMLRDHTCHAVERHGPHIATTAQLARLIWLKDPSGQEIWQLLPNGAAESSHWCGPVSGGFTSQAAMAKALAVFLRWAHDHAGSVNELITKYTKTKTKRFGIHVSAQLAGLVAGDTAGYRGTATTSKARTADWLAARERTMTYGAPPVYGVPYDTIAEGIDPGVTLAFKRIGKESWRLVTCYPVDRQNPENKRLEDLT